MSGINEKVRNFLNNIQNEAEIQTNLEDLKVALNGLSSNQRSEVCRNCRLNIFFDCLNTSNQEQIKTTCEVLKIVLANVPVGQLLTQNGPALIRALGHPTTHVKVVILEWCTQAAGSDAFLTVLENDITFLTSIGRCLCHEDVAVGKRAVDFFITLGQTKRGLSTICKPAFIGDLIENIGNNNVYVLRIFEVLVEISTTSDQALKHLENEGLLDRISSFLRTDDTLAMLALVEVCTSMSLTPHGWDFLFRHGIVKHLVELFVSHEDSPLSSLTFPGLAKFFGQVGQAKADLLFDSYPEVLRSAFTAVDSDDLNIFIPALELIGSVAYSSQGKRILQKQDERLMRHVMGRLYEAMTRLPTEWRVRALHTAANIVHVGNDFRTVEMMNIAETWFNQMGSSGLSSIQETAQQPFPDLKTAALRILLNIANQRWGQIKICEADNLLEFLLNRRTEHDAEGLQMKYDILKAIVDSGLAETTFERQEYEAIFSYVRQGPFFAQATTEVAIEGAE